MDQYEMNFTGAVESPKDDRDYDFARLAAGITELPKQANYDRPELSTYHQHKVPSCVNNAIYAGVLRVNYEEGDFKRLLDLSPRAGHAYCMALSGLPLGSGMYPRLAMDTVRKIGAFNQASLLNDSLLTEAEYINWKPQQNDFDSAVEGKIISYAFVTPSDTEALKKAIYIASTNSRSFVVALMKVGDTYWIDKKGRSTWDKDRILPIRRPKSITSGHEILFTGYRYEGERLVIEFVNSWGDTWADKGRGWFYHDEHADLITEVIVGFDADTLIGGFKYVFAKSLRKGDRGQDVLALQTFLKQEGVFNQNPTGYFGDVTFKSVCDFQENYKDEILIPQGLTKPTGFFGESSRKKAHALMNT